MKDYKKGILRGLPIGLGYFPVSFTFGLMVTSNNLPEWFAVLLSLTNLTSAGQFAGTQLILAKATLLEIGLAIFIINIRYMLMSLSLTQKIRPETTTIQRMIMGFGITDEAYAVASMEPHMLSAKYMYGLITLPIAGWTIGTACGAFCSSLLPPDVGAAMEIALYAMFIAIIIPPAKKSKPVLICIIMAVIISCIFKYISVFSFISDGFKIILTTLIAACAAAVLFPRSEEV